HARNFEDSGSNPREMFQSQCAYHQVKRTSLEGEAEKVSLHDCSDRKLTPGHGQPASAACRIESAALREGIYEGTDARLLQPYQGIRLEAVVAWCPGFVSPMDIELGPVEFGRKPRGLQIEDQAAQFVNARIGLGQAYQAAAQNRDSFHPEQIVNRPNLRHGCDARFAVRTGQLRNRGESG